MDYYYCGISGHIAQRIINHNAGGTISTRQRRPYIILHAEIFSSYKEARIRERQIKNYGVKRWYIKHVQFSTQTSA
jgi:predicted GIY-YIG superfamily endonuclease